MRKMFLLFGVLALIGVLFVACTDEQATAPPEPTEEAAGPDFSFQFPGCEAAFEAARPEGKARALFRVFDGQIIAVSLVRQVRRNATYRRYDRAAAKAWQLADLVSSKLPGRLVDPCGSGPPTTEAGAAMLMNDVFELAGVELPDGGIPPAAFGPGGGYGQIDPAVGGTILANNAEAALIADPMSFPGATGPVTIAFFRIPDPQPGVPNYPIPGFQAYPEAYDFSGSAQPTGGIDLWMCVVEDALPVPFANLRIGHNVDGDGVVLPPPDNPESPLDCSGAVYRPTGLVNSAPLWLQLAGQLLQPLADRLLNVQPLNAMYFAGKGLGGRGTSFSYFAPVDAGPAGSGDINVAIGSGYGSVINTNTGQVYCAVTGSVGDDCFSPGFPAGEIISLTAIPAAGYGFSSWEGCTDSDGPLCEVFIEGDTDVTAYFTAPVFHLMTVNGAGTGTGVITGGNGIDCTWNGTADSGQCSTSVEDWVNLEVVASADDASVFTGWTGDCSGTDPSCIVPMSQDRFVTATFSPTHLLTIAYDTDPLQQYGPGVVTDDGASNISCTYPVPDDISAQRCTAVYTEGTSVTLYATSDTHLFFAFLTPDLTWDCPPYPTRGTCTTTITMDADMTIPVAFGLF